MMFPENQQPEGYYVSYEAFEEMELNERGKTLKNEVINNQAW